MKFYNLPASPNARRVGIFLAEKGLEIPMVPVNMMTGENQTDDYLTKNFLGRMPLLELDDGKTFADYLNSSRHNTRKIKQPRNDDDFYYNSYQVDHVNHRLSHLQHVSNIPIS
ncbi:MAG: glutathione S-transferase N-terminal domain-containing protein [Gammaproteobacteria bacterium]|nr:glutathione S-transferase N-terminal domain-containing protein [Gammaproteobacteria bacterium]MBL4892899.1 glutathione S-transferase N-terminal domain-containing protein [Rhizobiaceae bacterium]